MDAVYIVTAAGEKKLLASTAKSKSMTYHKLDLGLNKAGEMNVSIPVTNSVLKSLNFLADEITFERNGVELFRGEADGKEQDILNTGEIRVTGALNYLAHLYMEPYEYSGSVGGYVKLLLDSYNSRALANRQIQIGSVTVTDPNDYIARSNTDRVNFLKLFQEKLVGKLGGYLRIRVGTDGTKYLDYLATFERTAAQPVKYGKNILEISQGVEYQDVYTVIIPEGHEDEETGEKLTVASVNNGSVYVIDQEAVDKYGWREIVVEWEDVTLPENLLKKAQEKLGEYTNPIKTVDVKAVDLALCSEVDCFYVGDMIHTESGYHDLKDDFLLSEMTIYALSPEEERLTLGAAKESYSESTSNRLSQLEEKIDTTKQDNWNLAQKIKDADGLYTTLVEDPENEGAQKIYLHDKKNLNDSMLQISFSTEGVFLTADGGATWYGISMTGDTIVRLLQAVGITADIIAGGLQISLAEDTDGNPVSWVNWDEGTFSFANGAITFDGQTFKIEQVSKVESQIAELKEQADATDQAMDELITMVEGIDGTYFYIRYSAYPDGHVMTDAPQNDTEYMGTCSTSSDTAPADYKAYTWCRIKGNDGTDGTPGVDGTSQYFHVKYSDDGETFTSNQGETLGDWMGTLVDSNPVDSTVFSDYEWHKIRGEAGLPGKDGIAGTDGKDGRTTYFHIKYSNVENPTTASQMTETPSAYIGTYVDYTEEDSNDPVDYKWMKFQGSDGIDGKDGTDGIPGTNGIDGQTYYLHIKYSDDGGKTFTTNNGEDSGEYIGVYTDTAQADSTDVSKYTWSLIKGADGVDGADGKDGTTYYTWIKYADTPTSGMSDDPEGKTYMGLAYNKTTATESTKYSDYTWSLIKGADGSDGINGIDGVDGVTYYTWVKYADDANGTNMSDDPDGKYYIGLAYNKATPTESTKASDYTWSLFRGANGVDGKDGADGISQYFYVRYSANANGNPMTSSPASDTKYMGVCSTTSPTAPTSYTAYTWTQCKGNDGTDGTPGEPGADGKTQYLHIKYSDDGKTFTGNRLSTDFSDWRQGSYSSGSTATAGEEQNYNVSNWRYISMTDVVQVNEGEKWLEKTGDANVKFTRIRYDTDGNFLSAGQISSGAGSTTYTIPAGVGYMRIALYSTVYTTEDAWRAAFENGSLVPEFRNTAEVAGEELGDWIGTLVDFEQKDSEVFTDYTWKKFTDDVDDELEEIRQTIVEQTTSLTNTCEQIVMEATEKYVEKTTFEEYKEETSSQFAIQSDEMSMKFTETQETIESVNGELQTTKEEWNKYFRFSIDGLEIGEEGNELTLKLDNDRIAFVKNGVVIAYWDGDMLRTGNLYVEVNQRAQFGCMAFQPRSDNTVMLLKVSDV